LEIIAGHDPLDASSSRRETGSYSKFLKKPIKGIRVGWPKNLFTSSLDMEIHSSIKFAAGKLEELGAQIVEIDMPLLEYGISLYYIIAPSKTLLPSRVDGKGSGKSCSLKVVRFKVCWIARGWE
jgi:aspartyl-tRNA(Asn)/glutamyl-tRNA(Gln) amidotransferase subunit A